MQSGTQLAHYRVENLVGRGGMGEVYRARDTKLDRDVALKILPREFASDGDRRVRFEREAKVLASLHHPNIASIFGFETVGEHTFLVMEYVEGDDLARVLKNGPLPVDEAVDVARQIAEGLEEAHENGIIHRDLKPANIKRTPDGRVKILDFGLARAFEGQSAGEGAVSSAPTMTAAMTQAGTIMGTAAYMSPEQARGKEVDRRTDIWAFGLILFEMLTGRQNFVGETASDTLAGILKSEPEWETLPPDLPYQVERVLRRCLAKEPRQRLRDIGEARVRLENPQDESGVLSGPVTAMSMPAGRSRRWPVVVPWSLLLVAVAGIAWLVLAGRGSGPAEPLHLAIPAPSGARFHIDGSFPGMPEISPDGRMLAFSARNESDRTVQLYVRALDAAEPVALGDTRDAQYPFWSPDSRYIAYYDRNEGLMKVPVNGGPPQMICKAGNGKGGSWNQFGDVLLTLDFNTSIHRAPAGGGEATPVTDLEADAGFNSHRHPQFLPDGRHFLYFARGGGDSSSQIRFASLDDSVSSVVTQSVMMGYYASGYLLFIANGDLVAQPMDPQTGRLYDVPTPLVRDVIAVPGAAKAAFSVSQEGSLVFLQGESSAESTLKWRDRTGRELGELGEPSSYELLSLSPDGRLAAVSVLAGAMGTWDIWIYDIERGFRTRFTNDPADDYDMVWTSESDKLYFISERQAEVGMYVREIGSPEPPRRVTGRKRDLRLWDLARDGRTALCSERSDSTEYDLWAIDLLEENPPRRLQSSASEDIGALFSPDEKWVAYASGGSGTPQIYVAPWPAMAPVTQVSISSGTWFSWTRGGAEIVYQEFSGRLMAVPFSVDEQGRARIGDPEPLFETLAPDMTGRSWEATADGEKFLLVDRQEAAVPGYANLVLDWPALLLRR